MAITVAAEGVRMWAAEEKLIALFTGGDRKLNWAYSEYRKRLLYKYWAQA